MAVTTSFGLIEMAKAGDQAAFERLFERYSRRLAVLVYYRLGPELRAAFEVDDLLQEIFLRAFRDLPHFTYESPGSFLRWLMSIAGHVTADAARYLSRDRRHAAETVRFRSASNPHGPEPADTRTPSRVLAQKDAVAALLRRLDALPENYRQAILLAKIEGLSTAEMAASLGVSREAAALLLHRALNRFRAIAEA
jgi:RNA polymerase sigma-70 factor (ECF subfamily)